MSTFKEIITLEDKDARFSINSVALFKIGKMLASIYEKKIRIWNVETGKIIKMMQPTARPIITVLLLNEECDVLLSGNDDGRI